MKSSILLVKLPEPKRARQKVSYVPPIGLWSIAHNLRRWQEAEAEARR